MMINNNTVQYISKITAKCVERGRVTSLSLLHNTGENVKKATLSVIFRVSVHRYFPPYLPIFGVINGKTVGYVSPQLTINTYILFYSIC
mmetsp:Transcript_29798/g.72648  ORF Transcript_29798/g.72648 Transcript_29798/m.72648 type:complete len:89 (+) Transcript_29798:2-268(+)